MMREGVSLKSRVITSSSPVMSMSAPNASATERRLLINAYSAADAVQLVPDATGSPLFGALVRGKAPRAVRRTAGELPLPPDFGRGYTSIYELQSHAEVNP